MGLIDDLKQSAMKMDELLSYLAQWAVCVLALGLHIGFLLVFHRYEIMPLFYFNIVSVLFYAGSICMLVLHWKKKMDLLTSLAAIEIILHQFLCMYLLGLEYGFQQYMVFTAAYICLYITKTKRMRMVNLGIATICIVVYAVSSVVFKGREPLYVLPTEVAKNLYYVISFSSFAILIVIVWGISYLRRQSYREAAQKAEELLLVGKLKEIFLQGVSSEVRAPLNSLIGMTEQFAMDEPSEERKKKLDYMWDVEKGIHSYVNDFLDLAKLEAGKLPLVLAAYNPEDLAEGTLEIFEKVAALRDLNLELDTSDLCSCQVVGDIGRIRQILISMLDNALRYTKEGSITLKVKGERQNDKCHLSFTVADTGIGIKPENKAKVMKLFAEADHAKGVHGSGTGLRMALAKMLAEWMGGSLKATSVYGKGSRFTFSLSQKIMENS